MITKEQWDGKVSTLGKKLFSLYWDENVISLINLNDFREILKDMDLTMQTLFKAAKFPSFYSTRHSTVRKEILKLENQYKVFEYNISLCSNGSAA